MNWAFWLQLFKRSARPFNAIRWINLLIQWISQLVIYWIVIYPVDIFSFGKTGALTDNILLFLFWIQNKSRYLCSYVENLYYMAVSLVSSTLCYWLRDFYRDMNLKKKQWPDDYSNVWQRCCHFKYTSRQ